MKKSFLLIFLVALMYSAKAQVPTEFWGVTEKGGYGFGAIFKTDNNGNNLVVTDAFKTPIAGIYPPEGRFCEAANGKLYGVMGGGIYDNGVLVELDPATGILLKKTDFNQPVNGMSPNGLVKASNGKLYGTTLNGGMDELGTLFEYDVPTNMLVTKVTFNGSGNGFSPYGDLILAANGKLYGVTQWGGTHNLGTLYEYDPATNTFVSKIAFSGTNGSAPKGALLQTKNGNLYGVTNAGGANDMGTIFEYVIASNTLTTKLSFGDSVVTGIYPYGGLELANDSLLYGTTSSGTGTGTNGILYKFNPANAAFTKILDFDPVTNGAVPYGSLKKASNGLLYGMTSQGGTTTNGTLFEFNTTTSAFNKLVDFDPIKGRTPYSTIMQASNGKLYAATSTGGKADRGVVFEYTITSHTFKKIAELEGGIDGEAPRGTWMLAANGKLYGTAAFDGAKGSGVLIECDPAINKGTFMKKFDFDRPVSGDRPVFAPAQAPNGKLYGTTEQGGASNGGVIYEFDPATNAFVKKIDFDGAGMGKSPGGLMLASNNKMYGMTTYGGTNGDGILFEFDPATGTFTKKFDFKGPETGAYPRANLIQSKINGKLYGLTSYSDNDHRGVLFEYDPAKDTLIKKIDFGGTDNGYDPEGSLVEVSNGHLYGLTAMGGTADAGTIFEYDPVTDLYSKKYDFNITDGQYPYGSLAYMSNGKLYGMTIGGGVANRGTMFEYSWMQNQFMKKVVFDGLNGMSPNRGTLLEVCKAVYIMPQPPGIIVCEKKPLIIHSGVVGPEYTYQWFKDGNLIKDSISGIYRVNSSKLSDAGNYYCKVSNGCRSINTLVTNVTVKPVTVSECFVMGMDNEAPDQKTVHIYPNPATDHFAIQVNAGDVKSITLEIFDLPGHLIQKETRAVTSNENTVTVGIETINSGVYLLKIWSSSNQLLKNEKLIIKK
jgi:uncharacterized repeat protein (TIGR03803 family)